MALRVRTGHHGIGRHSSPLFSSLPSSQVITGSAVYFLDETDQIVPFYVFASDGISYDHAYLKQMIVIGPCQREALLLQFSKPGLVRVMQGVINDFQVRNGL